MSVAGLAFALLPAELLPGRECLGDPLALLLAAIHPLGALVLLLPVDVAAVGVGVTAGCVGGLASSLLLAVGALVPPVPVALLGLAVLADGAWPWR